MLQSHSFGVKFKVTLASSLSFQSYRLREIEEWELNLSFVLNIL